MTKRSCLRERSEPWLASVEVRLGQKPLVCGRHDQASPQLCIPHRMGLYELGKET